MKRSKFKLKERPIFLTILIAAFLSTALGMLMTAVLAYITLNGTISYGTARMWMAIIHFAGVLCGGISTVFDNAKKGLILPLMATGAYVLILLGTNILFWGAGVKIGIAEIVAILLPSGIVALIMLQKGRTHTITKFRR